MTMHTFLRLLLARPQLVADHAQAYAELMAAELGDASTELTRRMIVGGAGVLCLLVAAILAGMALLLCAVTTAAQIQAPWALIVVPLVPLALSMACMVWVRAQQPLRPLVELRRQARADMDLLRESSAS
jgi:hypothetical protein